MVADARHFAMDMFADLIILSGLIGGYLRLAFPLDNAMSLIFVPLTAWAGFKIAVDAIRVLLDASLEHHPGNYRKRPPGAARSIR